MFEDIGGQRVKSPVVHEFYPDSSLKDTLEGYETAGTPELQDIYIVISTSNNNEVSLAGNGVAPNGKIVNYKKDKTYGYILSVSLFKYADYEGNLHTPIGIFEFSYGENTAPSLGEEIQMDGTDGDVVDGVTSGGIGKIINVDTTNSVVHAIV